MALTRIKTDQITDGQVKGGDIDSTNTLVLGSINATAISLSGNITTLGELRGPASFVIDPAAVGDNTGTVVIKGNLQVDGLTTTINSTTLTIDDKNIVLASGAATAAAADGAGISVDGASATLLYSSTPDSWSFNKNLGIGTTTPSAQIHAYSGDIMVGDGASATSRMFRAVEVGVAGNNAGISFGNNGSKGAIYGQSGTGGMYIVGSTNGGGSPLNFGYSASDTGLSANYSSLGAWNTTGLGIGNTNPTAKLDVTGTTKLSAKLTVSTFGSRVRNLEVYGSEALLDASDGTFDLIIGDGVFAYMPLTTTDNATALKIRNYTGNTDIATFERVSGNVGIGTGPVSKLHVLGTGTLGYATANAITSGMSAISNVAAFNNIGAARLTSNFGGAVAFTGRATELVFTGDNGNFGSGGGFAQGILGSITAQSETGNAATFASSMIFYTTSNNALNERMRINSNGYVGIQNTVPAAPLHVGSLNGTGSLNGYTRFALESTDYAVATWKSPAANFSQIIFTDTTTTSLGGINYFNSTNATPNAMTFLTVNTERMRIDSSGNVGIGTTSPGTLLNVYSATADNGKILIQSGTLTNNNRAGLFMSATNVNGNTGNVSIECNHPNNQQSDMVFRTGATDATSYGSERMRITTDGAVRVSTGASQNSDAFVVGPTSGTAAVGDKIRLGFNLQNTAGGVTGNFFAAAIGGIQDRAGANSGALGFYTQTSAGDGTPERMRIDSSGNLLVGTTSTFASAKVAISCPTGTQSVAFGIASAVTRASGTQYGYTIWRDNTTETNAVTFVENGSPENNAASYVVRTNAATGGSTVTSVSGGVALVNGATSWSSYSDLRLKHDVVPVTNAIESLLKIDPIFFKWNDRPEDQQRSIGVSAQSVEKVFPELIDRSGIYDVEGGAMQVRYTELIPVLLASIQEQQALITALTARVAQLESN